MKERQLHNAIFREEWGDLFAVRDCRQDLQQEGFPWRRLVTPWQRKAFAALALPQSDPGLIRSG